MDGFPSLLSPPAPSLCPNTNIPQPPQTTPAPSKLSPKPSQHPKTIPWDPPQHHAPKNPPAAPTDHPNTLNTPNTPNTPPQRTGVPKGLHLLPASPRTQGELLKEPFGRSGGPCKDPQNEKFCWFGDGFGAEDRAILSRSDFGTLWGPRMSGPTQSIWGRGGRAQKCGMG